MGAHRLGKAALGALAVAVTARMLPQFWTRYPFNPDAFNFAAQADATLAGSTLAHDLIGPHGYVYPTLLAQASAITGVDPLWLAQPTIAVIGALPAALVVLFVWRVRHTAARPALLAAGATAAGLVLALEGVYLRRTVTVSYEVLGLLFIILVALATHRWLRTRRPAWGLTAGTMLAALPVTHHLSTFMTGLAVTVVVLLAALAVGRRGLVPGVAVAGVFWLYAGGYYWVTRPPFSADLAAKPGLFVAWVVMMCAFAYWLVTATNRAVRVAGSGLLVGGFGVLAGNAVWNIFPGTAMTPLLLVSLVAPVVVFGLVGVWGLPAATGVGGDRAVSLALVAAPVAWVGFSLTAGLDPVYALFARRGQTFVHFAVAVSAGVALVDLLRPGGPLAGQRDSLKRHGRWFLPTARIFVRQYEAVCENHHWSTDQ